MATFNDHMFKSLPIPVRFQGWESDTYTLQKAGWRFHVERDPARMSYRFLLQNDDLRLGGFSDRWEFDMIRNSPHQQRPPLYIQQVMATDHTRIRCEEAQPYASFVEVDFAPTYLSFEEHSMDMLFPFNLKNAPDIIMDSKADMEVVDYLQAILDGQQEKQKEIRQQRRRHVDGVEVEDIQPKFRIVI